MEKTLASSYKTFIIHQDAPRTVGGISADYLQVTVMRNTITGVREDRDDPEGFLLETTLGPLHVKANEKELIGWLEEGVRTGDTGKSKK